MPKGIGKSDRKSVRVIVRARPTDAKNTSESSILHYISDAKHFVQLNVSALSQNSDEKTSQTFHFDRFYDEQTTQRLLFQREIVPILKTIVKGKNASIFTYGAANSGKKYTMEGSKRNAGILPRCIKHFIQLRSAKSAATDSESEKLHIFMSYFELFNEKIQDLLAAKGKAQPDLPIRQHSDQSIEITGLTKKEIKSLDEFQALYAKALSRRQRNGDSTSSFVGHGVLMIQIKDQHWKSRFGNDGKLFFTDLVGHEENRRSSHSDIRPNKHVTMSLYVLGQVLTALNKEDQARIPYRNTKLTRVLQDALSRESQSILLCTVNPIASKYNEFVQTLNYASKIAGMEARSMSCLDSAHKVAKTTSVTKKSSVPSSICPSHVRQRDSGAASEECRDFVEPAKARSNTSPFDKSAEQLGAKRVCVASAIEKNRCAGLEKKLEQWRQQKKFSASLPKKPERILSESTPKPRDLGTGNGNRSRSFDHTSNPKVMKNTRPDPAFSSERKRQRILASAQVRTTKISPPCKDQRQLKSSSKRIDLSTTVKTFDSQYDKENVAPVSSGANDYIALEAKQVETAKQLITLAIEFEKKEQYWSSLCTYRKALVTLPSPNEKLAAKVKDLDVKCVNLAMVPLHARISMAQSSTLQLPMKEYMQRVYSNNLLEILNTGSFDDVMTLPTIGEKRALKIMESRPFQKVEDIRCVPGITTKMVERIQEQVHEMISNKGFGQVELLGKTAEYRFESQCKEPIA